MNRLDEYSARCKVFLAPGAQMPYMKSVAAAGYDLAALEDVTLTVGRPTKVRTGVYLELPEGIEGQIRPRSGLSNKGVIILNAPGTIDSDYRGEILVAMTTLWGEENTNIPLTLSGSLDALRQTNHYTIKAGERIAQLVFAPIIRMQFDSANTLAELSETTRGAGGFGSTGK